MTVASCEKYAVTRAWWLNPLFLLGWCGGIGRFKINTPLAAFIDLFIDFIVVQELPAAEMAAENYHLKWDSHLTYLNSSIATLYK